MKPAQKFESHPQPTACDDIGTFPATHLQEMLDRVTEPGADRRALARDYVSRALSHSRLRLTALGEL